MRNDIRSLLLLLLLFVSNINVNAFGTTIGRCHGHLKSFRSSGCFYTSSSSSALYAKNKKNRKSGKGFGAAEQSQSKPVAVDTPVVESSSSSSSVSPTITTSVQEPVKNAGQLALERLEAEERKKKDEELRRVREMRDVDQAVKGDVNAAVIPEKVAQRMTKRMLPFVGIPLFGVMGVFVTFWYLRVYKDMVFETSLVAVSTIGVLVVSLLGITYSVMSASWDEDREGSFFGIDEFQSNVQNIKDGLGRSKENAVLRDRMANLSESEIEAALADLERREKKKANKGKSFKQKLEEEGL